MHSLKAGTRLVVASHNKGKVWEIQQLIAPYGLDAVSAGDLNLAEPEETELTFAGNARLKAVAAAAGSGLPALADDSGLEVACLEGAPGIYSARWAGPGKDFGVAMEKVATEISARHGWMAGGPRANFISVLCLAWPDGRAQVFEGKVFGHLVWPPRGGNGFGYDPMFVPDGDTRTYGEMPPAEKYAGSHRTRAFAAFKAAQLEPMFGAKAPAVAAPNGFDAAAHAAAAASISTRDEFVALVQRLSADLNAHAPALRAAELLTEMDAALRATPGGDAPAWRTLASALVRASTALSRPAGGVGAA